MRRRFVSVLEIGQLARRIIELSATGDVYLGPTLRDCARRGRAAISASRVLYIESDDPGTPQRLASFPCRPAMIVASGSPGHLHIYWRLHEPAAAAEVERANRLLAFALGGEARCTDVARMLRPPGSLNYKHSPPAPVRLLAHDASARWALADLHASLPDAPHLALRSRSSARRRGRSELDRALLSIPTADYVRVLTDREPDRTGKVSCPFHQETDPSLHLYDDGTFYCFGASCRKGGTIFDFAASLWGTGTRGEDFFALRRRLADTFHLSTQQGEAPR
ncbi:MAG TPA: DNA-primase RepB domain-containing protein [Solirubrobacteraceae bacterium]|nr:DNA-primase RepB domain-containing protein [Solirubrobacteraceae bacterium]